ncbi:hypothetical protein ABW20_dc0104365 [Dactylellina cionopaga]|nr:hypothetical protein ABW20_dc0104365 [Dactylellina cionopaga]
MEPSESAPESPAYQVDVHFSNQTDWPLTFTGFKGQTGGDWNIYPPQVIDGKEEGRFLETLHDITDHMPGSVEYALCDGANILEIKLSWLSPHPPAGRQAMFKWEMEGDDDGIYEIKNTVDENAHATVTFTLSVT